MKSVKRRERERGGQRGETEREDRKKKERGESGSKIFGNFRQFTVHMPMSMELFCAMLITLNVPKERERKEEEKKERIKEESDLL